MLPSSFLKNQITGLILLQAADYLDQALYDTGNPEDDLKTQSWIDQLVYHPKLKFACPLPFNEARLWKGQGEPDLMHQIQKQFRNIRFSINILADSYFSKIDLFYMFIKIMHHREKTFTPFFPPSL